MSDTEAVIAWHARRSELVDWLLGATVQSAYPIFAAGQMRQDYHWRRDKVFDWQNAPQFDSLGQRYWAKYRSSGRMEWAVLAMLFPLAEDQTKSADALYSGWLERTLNCAATPAEYAAFATVYFERSTRDVWAATTSEQDALMAVLPFRMRDVIITRAARAILARQTVGGSWQRQRDDLAEAKRGLARLRALTDTHRSDASAVLNEIAIVFAQDIQEVADLVAQSELPRTNLKVERKINLLSVADLRVLATDQRLPKPMRIDLSRVIFLRLFALGRDTEAEQALADLYALDEWTQIAAEKITDLTKDRSVKLALAALTMPGLSLRYGSNHIGGWPDQDGFRSYFSGLDISGADLPDWLRTGGGLQADVQRLLQVGRFWFSQKGYTYDAMRRQFDRGMNTALPEPRFVGFPPQGPYDPGVPFGRLVALDELARLGPESGLTQRLSEVIIAWADAGSDTLPEMILQQNGAMPRALAQIVQLNRYRMRGDVDGVFAGKAAFRLLHARFPLGVAARATPYWYKCSSSYCDR